MAAASSHARLDPLVSPSGTVVWFDGRLDNREELTHLCPPRAADPERVCDAAFVLGAYEHFGDRFVTRLNGDFALALLDVSRQQLILARDVMAARSLYYCPLPGRLLFASEIKCILADPGVSASPDEDSLAELVLDYWCDGERTCFNGIYSVPPGQLVLASGDRIERREHWTFDPSRQVRYRSFDEYRDNFKSLFEQAVRRRLRSAHPVAIEVSGGVDSSSIFCQAGTIVRDEALPVRLHGVTLTYPPESAAHEDEFLAEIETRYDTPITRIPVSQYRFVEHADATVRQLEAPGVVSHTLAQIFETARHAGCRVLLSGFFGDQVLSDRGYLVDLARAGRWLKIRHDLREFSAWMTDADADGVARDFRSRVIRGLPPRWLFRVVKGMAGPRRARTRHPPWFTARFRERAFARASQRFPAPRRFASAHAEQYYRHTQAGHYANYVRSERVIGEMYGVEISYPFRDRDLVAFLMAIPGEIVNWRGVPKGLLREALSGVVPDAIRNRRWKADFTAIENDSLRQGCADLARLVPRDGLAVCAGLVDGDILHESLGSLVPAGDAHGVAPGWRLTDVVGLELWLRNFFSD